MILLIHGNDIELSRKFYIDEKSKAKNPVVLNGEGLEFNILFQALENKSFLNDKTTLVIENYFTKNKSNTLEFKKIMDYVNSNKEFEIIFWESDEVSKTSLSLIKNLEIKNFSLPQNIFAFLDNIKPENGRLLLKSFEENLLKSETELIYFMIVRQFRIMLNLISQDLSIDETKRMAPWQLSKIKNQANYFGKEELIKHYNKLLEIDLANKTGKSPLGLKKSIDFFLSDL